jgi:hypothetical protein
MLRAGLTARRLKRTSEETGGQMTVAKLRIGEARHLRLVERGERRRLSRGERSDQTVIHVLPGTHAALHHVTCGTMMAVHVIFWRLLRRRLCRRMMMPAMRQAAHAVAIRHAGIAGSRQQSQRRSQQYDDHEDGLRTTHRQKFYHSCSRPASVSPSHAGGNSTPTICTRKSIAVR